MASANDNDDDDDNTNINETNADEAEVEHSRVKRNADEVPQRTIKVKKLIRKVANKSNDNAKTNRNNNVRASNNSGNSDSQSIDCDSNCELHTTSVDIDMLANNDNYNANNTRINDKVNSKRSNNNSNEHNENTQDDESTEQQQQQPIANVRLKKRRIVPIRRTRINALPVAVSTDALIQMSDDQSQSTPAPIIETTSQQPTEHKRKLFVKRRRITPKPTTQQPNDGSDELLNVSTELAEKPPANIRRIPNEPIESTTVTTETRLSTKHRTYTYLVTRVHDHQSETISSTFVRDQIATITDTITKTILVTPTATIKYQNIRSTRIH